MVRIYAPEAPYTTSELLVSEQSCIMKGGRSRSSSLRRNYEGLAPR